MTTLKIRKINTTPEIDPYHRDTQQLTETYLTIDLEDGELWIDQECDDNSTPEPAWNNRWVMLNLSRDLDGAVLDADAIRKYLESPDAIELHARIMAGAEIEWNGSNHVGHISDDADAALDELTEEIKGYTSNIEIWSCEAYLYDAVTANMTDTEIEQLISDIESDKNLLIVDGDPAEYIRERRKELQDAE